MRDVVTYTHILAKIIMEYKTVCQGQPMRFHGVSRPYKKRCDSTINGDQKTNCDCLVLIFLGSKPGTINKVLSGQ